MTNKIIKKENWKDRITALEELTNSSGWEVMKETLNTQIKLVEIQILEKQILNIKITEDKCDELRAKRLAYKDILNAPLGEIEDLRDKNEAEEPKPKRNFDPYATVEDMTKET